MTRPHLSAERNGEHEAPPRAHDPRSLSPEEIQRELAQLLATGYLRLLAEASQREKGRASQQRSGAPGGQECALERHQNDLELPTRSSPARTHRREPPAGRS